MLIKIVKNFVSSFLNFKLFDEFIYLDTDNCAKVLSIFLAFSVKL